MVTRLKPTEKSVLVICVDRDNDIGVKTGKVGPIIGKKANLDIATKLALRDPADSDVNAIFYAVKIYDKTVKRTKAEIVTLTGDREVGFTSDKRLILQLEQVLRKYHATEAILVSDGAGDEYVLPLFRTKIPIIYPKQIIVRQSKQLEGAYYVIYDFLKSIITHPRLSRTFIGLPALLLILLAVFGSAGWRLILGFGGLYLFIKGFHLEPYTERLIKELFISLRRRKLTFFFYIVSFVTLIVALVSGYNAVIGISSSSLLTLSSIYIHNSIFLIFIAFVTAEFGRVLGAATRNIPKYISYFALSLSFSWIIYTLTDYIVLGSESTSTLLTSIGGSAIIVVFALALEKFSK